MMNEGSGASHPTGQQFEISHGDRRVVITEVGATLRSFEIAGHEILDTFGVEEMSAACRGQVLLPFPNRIDGGRYTLDGAWNQLPINEPATNNAIHGLTRWSNWTLVSHTSSQVEMALRLYPQSGWPYMISLQLVYELSDAGLTVTTIATNAGTTPLPFGAGYHPYFTVGTPTIDTCELRLPARAYLETNDRLIPTGKKSVEGTEFDFREAREIGDVRLDTCFTDLIPDEDGYTRVTLSSEVTGREISLHMDSQYRFIQVFTGDTLPEEERRLSIAIEPMTCAPNAFNTREGLIVLQSGESFTGTWSTTAS